MWWCHLYPAHGESRCKDKGGERIERERESQRDAAEREIVPKWEKKRRVHAGVSPPGGKDGAGTKKDISRCLSSRRRASSLLHAGLFFFFSSAWLDQLKARSEKEEKNTYEKGGISERCIIREKKQERQRQRSDLRAHLDEDLWNGRSGTSGGGGFLSGVDAVYILFFSFLLHLLVGSGRLKKAADLDPTSWVLAWESLKVRTSPGDGHGGMSLLSPLGICFFFFKDVHITGRCWLATWGFDRATESSIRA